LSILLQIGLSHLGDQFPSDDVSIGVLKLNDSDFPDRFAIEILIGISLSGSMKKTGK